MSFTPKSHDSANSLNAHVKKVTLLSARDWYVMCRACVFVPVVWVRLRVLGLPRTLAWAAAARGSDLVSGTRALPPASLGRLVNIAARYGPMHAACLVRSLVLIRILSGHGVQGTLKIGVRKGLPSQLDAHAWVEFDGIPVNDHLNVAGDFAVFETLDTFVVGPLL